MRAKEYIEIHKSKLEFAEQITTILEHCAKMRTDFAKTIKFYETYLSSVENIQRYFEKAKLPKIKKESFWKLLREELQPTIRTDKSYNYLYLCVSQEKDILKNHISTDKVQKYICQQFEDYPKQFIDDFVCAEPNKNYYENICDVFSTSEDILNVFNTAYEIFDNIRVQMYKPIQASFYFKEYPYKSDRHKYFILPLVAAYLNDYDYDLTDSQKKSKQKVSDELSKYIAQSIDPQSEIVKAKSYWYFFQNTLKITVGDKEKLALLITEQTKFNQLPENERQIYGADFGRNCQLEIDKIRELQALNVSTEDETEKSGAKRTLKVTADVLMSLLQQAGISAASDDKAKMARLIAYLTDFSEEKIRQRLSNTEELTLYHKAEVENINEILSSLNSNISMKYNNKR